MIRLHNLAVTYQDDGKRAVDGLSLEVERGERVVLLGPSGCGKTTALRALLGLLRRDEARVEGEIDRGGAKLAAVFQRPALFPWLSVRANVAFPLIAAGRRAADRGGAVTTPLLEMAGLAEYADAPPQRLSAGMSQRVSLLRALASEPDVVVLDEPFSSLDVATKERAMADFRRLCDARGVGALYVTHDLREALAIGDRLVVLTASPARERSRYDLRGRSDAERAPLLAALARDYEG